MRGGSAQLRSMVVWSLVAAAVAACGDRDRPDDDLQAVRAPQVARLATASEAIAGAHIPTLDPATMVFAEIEKAIETGPRCMFRYTSAGKPVMAFRLEGGVPAMATIKLNGQLVTLPRKAAASGAATLEWAAEALRIVLVPKEALKAELDSDSRLEASMLFEIGSELRVGYGGYYNCMV